jgi:hypothetical protein
MMAGDVGHLLLASLIRMKLLKVCNEFSFQLVLCLLMMTPRGHKSLFCHQANS